MILTVRIPDCPGLEEEINQCRADVAASAEQCAQKNAAIDQERQKLILVEQEINAAAPALMEQCALNADAASKYVTGQARLSAIASRLAELEKQAVNADYSCVYPVVEQIVRHYIEHLPGVIARQLESVGFCETDRGGAVVPFTGAMNALPRVRSIISNKFLLGFTQNDFAEANKIFDRALRGQPHLLFDPPTTSATRNPS